MPKNWYQLREGHYAHVVAMGVWLAVATIISLAYTSQLLASLTAKEPSINDVRRTLDPPQ